MFNQINLPRKIYAKLLRWPAFNKLILTLEPIIQRWLIFSARILSPITEIIKAKYLLWVPEKIRILLERYYLRSKNPLKLAGKATLGFCFGFYILILITTLVIDPNDFKLKFENYLQEKTGKSLTVVNLKWSGFPRLKLIADEIVLKKKSEASKNIFKIQRIKLYPKLFSLIFGKIDIDLTIVGMEFNKHLFPHIFARLVYGNSVLKIKGIEVDLEHGTETGTLEIDRIVIDHREDIPKYHIRHESDDFQLPLLLSVLKLKTKVSGATDIKFDIKAQGKALIDIKRSAQGSVDIKIQQGRVHGLDLLTTLKGAKSLIGTIASKISNAFGELGDALLHRKHVDVGGITHFSHAKMSASISNGIVMMHELSIIHPHFHVKGKGGINLVNNTLDYYLEALYKENGEIKKGDAARGLAPLVVRITGPVTDPKIKPDMDSYMKYIQQCEVGKKKETKKGKKGFIRSIKRIFNY